MRLDEASARALRPGDTLVLAYRGRVEELVVVEVILDGERSEVVARKAHEPEADAMALEAVFEGWFGKKGGHS